MFTHQLKLKYAIEGMQVKQEIEMPKIFERD
jgi:hypothetical protein